MNKNILSILREQKKLKLKGNLYHITQVQFAYNTNHIEGSNLTEEQTRFIYETNTLINDTDKAPNIDDIVETANHFYLFDYMLDTADDILSEDLIKEYHKLLKRGTSSERLEWFRVGDYKSLKNEVNGTETTTPNNVQTEIRELILWYNSLEKVAFEDILEFHYRFEAIHPFQDGNGRIGRIIMFKECLKNDIIPFIILDEYKAYYYRGLKEFRNEKGYLTDTCLLMQDRYKDIIERLNNKN